MAETTSLFDLFIEESREHLEIINESLLQLEKDPGDVDLINSLFRSVHTIKGSSAAMGYAKTSELIHQVEELIQLMREGKIRINQKLIQLLFVFHDYLGNFLDTVMNNGKESELQNEHISIEVLSYLTGNKEDNPPDQNHPASFSTKELEIDGAKFQESLLGAEEGSNLYLINILLDQDCVFKSIRVWMIFEELNNAANIMSSYPQQPSIDDFKDGSFTHEDNQVLAVVVSTASKNELNDILSQISEIESFYIDSIPLAEGDPLQDNRLNYDENRKIYTISFAADHEDFVKQIIGESNEKSPEIPPGFLKEIKENVRKAQQYLSQYGTNSDILFDFSKLYRTFHTIKGLAGYIEHNLIYEIADKTEKTVDYFRKQPASFQTEDLELIRLSGEIIYNLCETTVAGEDKQQVGQIDDHLERLIRIFSQESQKAAPGAKINPETVKEIDEDKNIKTDHNDEKEDQIINADNGQKEATTGFQEIKQIIKHIESKPQTPKETVSNVSFIRIPENKVDYLVDMLSELTIIQSLHKQDIKDTFFQLGTMDNSLLNNIQRMERIIKDIQYLSMSLRMVSLKQTFQKLTRIGRDSARELNKAVDINILGEETEIDRSVVEKIQDPLMHLLRNSISHGLEDDDERTAKGKTLPGQVTLKAYNRRGSVYIEVQDDGRGLDKEKIYKKALEKGLIENGKEYKEEEIIHLIFLPGFSTQDQVNSISGRGVGMNVVETEIKKIGGKIDIRNSPGSGCAFILKIPINLATINGTILEIRSQRYIIPTLNIKHIFKPESSQWVRVKGKITMVDLRGQLIPLIPPEKILNFLHEDFELEDCTVIVLELDNKLKALPVSNILGKQEIVRKPLGDEFSGLRIFSGGTILGDGKICLILDIDALFMLGESEEVKR